MISKLPTDNENDTEPKRKFTRPIDNEVYDETLSRLNWYITFFYRMMMILVCISVLKVSGHWHLILKVHKGTVMQII